MMKKLWEELYDPRKKYRPHPFWSWNDELDETLCKLEIDEMEKAGMGGFFMHARTGLKTEYLSEKWMDVTRACIAHAAEKGMMAWGYDEDGWPSGFAGGKVQEVCEESKIQWIELDENEEIVFCKNPGYVDLLNEKTTDTFLQLTHQTYRESLPKEAWKNLCGFFTDEPQYRREKIPYSPKLEQTFLKLYGYSLRDNLKALFLDVEQAEKVRYDFYKLVSEQFVENFTKRVYDFLTKEQLGFTGHMLHEESLLCQMQGTAGVMPHYQYMTIPGMDWLGRSVSSPLVPKQVASVAAQTGKEQVLSETFALCGWDVSFEELKWIAHWQIVNGVTLICQHLEGYTLRGVRKRDYPPSLFYQQPYWEQYRSFNQYLGRLGQLLSKAEATEDTCMIHPIRSAWIAYHGKAEGSILILDHAFEKEVIGLAESHVSYHFADEGMMARMGRVTADGGLEIGKCIYHNIVLPTMYGMDTATLELLEELASAGGRIFAVGALPEYLDGKKNLQLRERLKKIVEICKVEDMKAKISDHLSYDISIQNTAGQEIGDIQVLCKKQGSRRIYFLVNMSREIDYVAAVSIKGAKAIEAWNLWEYNRQKKQVLRENGYGKILVKLHAMEGTVLACEENSVQLIPVADTLKIRRMEKNALTLDLAEYRMDEGEWQEKKAVILIMRELLSRRKTAEVDLRFRCRISATIEEIGPVSLVMESPETYQISINGQSVSWVDQGWYRDSSFRQMDVSKFLIQGENEILLHTTFYQRDKVYEVLFGKDVLETERNKLTYDTELENIYLCGHFGVYSDGEYVDMERNAFSTQGNFYLSVMPETLNKGDFTKQGLLFYAGNMELSQKITVDEGADKNHILKFDRKPSCAVMTIFVNGKAVRTFAGGDLETDLTGYLTPGENEIVYQFGGTNRNLLGPHHFILGESYSVGPDTFTDVGGWTEPLELQGKPIWSDGYCFVPYGF